MTDPHEARRRKIAFTAFTALALIWGYNWVVMKIALSYAPPMAFGALRTGAAALFLFTLLLVCGRSPRMPAGFARLALLGLFQTTGFVGLVNYALSRGDAGKTAILAYTMPFWVLLLAAPVLGERITSDKVLAGGLGLVGILMIFSPWTTHGDLLGMGLASAAGLDWAASVMVAKKIPVHGVWTLLALNAWQMLIGSIPLGIAALAVPEAPIRWSSAFVLAFLYNVALGTGLAWFLWLFVLSRLSASLSGLAALIIPVIGILADWAQLGARPGPWETLGGVILLAGLGWIAWSERRRDSRR